VIIVTPQQARILDVLKARVGERLTGRSLAKAAGIPSLNTLGVQIYNLRERFGPALDLDSETYGPSRGYVFNGLSMPYAYRERIVREVAL
jgi:hypothetical protein